MTVSGVAHSSASLRRGNVSLTYCPFRRIWALQEPDFSLVKVANPCALRVHSRVEKPEMGRIVAKNRVHTTRPNFLKLQK